MLLTPLRKALSMGIVLAAATFGPLVWSGNALAEGSKEAPAKTTQKAGDASAKPGKSATKTKAKNKKRTATKATAKAEKGAPKHQKADSKAHKTKRARETKPASKRAAPPAKSDDAPHRGATKPASLPTSDDSPRSAPRAAKKAAAAIPCAGPVVSLDRAGVESDRFVLTDCHNKPLDSAVKKISILARPFGAPKRTPQTSVDPGVVKRIAAIAKKFPGRTVSIIGGPKPNSSGSAHQSGKDVDLRVDGIDNRKLVEACRTLTDTGCGYYPNASFVHIDARAAGSGSTYWIDASDPGEPPRYVSAWPPSADAKPVAAKPDASARHD
ncbi:MAG: DUF882 domain-containing protein [Polyangiaceae bacterium]|nr:DUF882 domain-containing protein [Polyangiaceae bacterium]